MTAVLFPGVAAAQISATPVRVEFSGTGEAERGVTVTNEGNRTFEVRFYPGDFDVTEEGRYRFLPEGEHPRSCSSRLSVSPEGTTLAPDESTRVRIRMTPGSSTCWSMVFAEVGRGTERGVRVAQRIGINVFGLGRGATRDAGLRSVSVGDGDSTRTVRFSLENRGSEPLRVTGDVEIRSTRGRTVETVRVPDFRVLPDRLRAIEVPLEGDLAPGTYLAIPILDYGSDSLVGGQATFRVPEPPAETSP